jgi:hypothetical protein
MDVLMVHFWTDFGIKVDWSRTSIDFNKYLKNNVFELFCTTSGKPQASSKKLQENSKTARGSPNMAQGNPQKDSREAQNQSTAGTLIYSFLAHLNKSQEAARKLPESSKKPQRSWRTNAESIKRIQAGPKSAQGKPKKDSKEAQNQSTAGTLILPFPAQGAGRVRKTLGASGKAPGASGKAPGASGKAPGASGRCLERPGRHRERPGRRRGASGKAPGASGRRLERPGRHREYCRITYRMNRERSER